MEANEAGSTLNADEANIIHGLHAESTESVTSVDNVEEESSPETTPVSINGSISSSMDNSGFRRSGSLAANGDSVEDKINDHEMATLTINDSVHDIDAGGEPVHDVDFGIDVDEENYQKRCQSRDTMYMTQPDANGKKRRIDYVLVYEEETPGVIDERRKHFEHNLEVAELEVETEDKAVSADGKSFFVKIHCPWHVLLKGATLLKMRKKLKLELNETTEFSSGCCACVSCLSPNTNVIPIDNDEYFTAVFDEARIDIFHVVDEETFFTNAERSLIAKMMLDRIEYNFHNIQVKEGAVKDPMKVHVGIGYLLRHNVYTGAFPLHEGSLINCSNDSTLYEGEDKDRLRLYQAWARPKNMFLNQPLHLIRKYFGEKIGFYYAWLGVYTTMLVPAAVFGIACLLYGLITLPGNETTNAVCSSEANSSGNYVMCPACDRWCNYTVLKDSCIYARMTHVFENKSTIAMAIFMSAWALVFIEMWKRKQASLQYDWDVEDYEREETIRPDFQLKITTCKYNPITRRPEPYLTGSGWFVRRGTSSVVLLFMVLIVLAAIFSVIIYRLAIVAALFSVEYLEIRAGAKLITSITSSVINLIACMVLSLIYAALARWLTNFEAYRTQTAYEDSLTFKLVVFQFINFYGFIFYIAFFKGSFIDRPGENSMYIFEKYREDQCDPAGCIVDLTIQLAVIMIGKQFLNSVQQICIPWILSKWRSRDVKNEEIYMRWEQDYDLNPVSPLTLFSEYLSMVIQFGFVTLFVTSFPPAPLFALINNLIETRLDAYKMVKMLQRPTAVKAQGIGAWFRVIKLIAFLSVITNGFIIAWTSDLIPKMVYAARSDTVAAKNYVDYSLSVFNTSDFLPLQKPDSTVFNGTIEICRYTAHRYGPNSPDKYGFTADYWIIFCARLAFVIVFEHVCILIMFCVMMVIPDESGRVKRMRAYECELNRKLAFDEKFSKLLTSDGGVLNGVDGTVNDLHVLINSRSSFNAFEDI